MLWYKAWLETRWRFFIGLILTTLSAIGTVVTYPQVVKLIPMIPTNLSGPIGERVREAAQLARSYHGFVWSHWYSQNLSQLVTIFAVILGTAGLLSQSGGALFTLSLPISRSRLIGVRAAAGFAELFVITFIPSLLIPLLSPSIGEHYSLAGTLVYTFCTFIAASIFLSFAFLLSTIFSDVWPPLLIALAVAFAISLFEQLLNPQYGIYHVMHGETYFRSGHLPWLGLILSIAVSASLFYGAVVQMKRRDF